MIDIHSHLLWNVDDGPETMELSLKMLNVAAKEGITEIVVTPHYNHPLYSVKLKDVEVKVNILQNELNKNNTPIKLHTGHEVRLTSDIINLQKSVHFHTLANSKYILLELPSNFVSFFVFHMIHDLNKKELIPIIAHPERNKEIISNPDILEKMIQIGALAQVTSGSLAGLFGSKIQRFALKLIKSNLIHTYGSDAHNLTNRPFLFNEGLAYLEKRKQLDMVDLFLENNNRVVKNMPIALN